LQRTSSFSHTSSLASQLDLTSLVDSGRTLFKNSSSGLGNVHDSLAPFQRVIPTQSLVWFHFYLHSIFASFSLTDTAVLRLNYHPTDTRTSQDRHSPKTRDACVSFQLCTRPRPDATHHHSEMSLRHARICSEQHVQILSQRRTLTSAGLDQGVRNFCDGTPPR